MLGMGYGLASRDRIRLNQDWSWSRSGGSRSSRAWNSALASPVRLFLEQALDQDHPGLSIPGVEAEGIPRGLDRRGPFPALGVDQGDRLVVIGTPGIDRDGLREGSGVTGCVARRTGVGLRVIEPRLLRNEIAGSERVGADNLTAGPGRESLVDRQISGVGVSAVRLASPG